MTTHHGHPIGHPAPHDATASRLSDWYREPHDALPPAIETHFDLWLRRESLEAELEWLRTQYRTASAGERRDLTERAGMAQASINNLTERLNQLRPQSSIAA